LHPQNKGIFANLSVMSCLSLYNKPADLYFNRRHISFLIQVVPWFRIPICGLLNCYKENILKCTAFMNHESLQQQNYVGRRQEGILLPRPHPSILHASFRHLNCTAALVFCNSITKYHHPCIMGEVSFHI
jgi:hypothetical protein